MRLILTALCLGLVVIAFIYTPAIAQERPVQLSLFAPIQLFPQSYSITGLRLSLIYGKNTSVSGIDLGLVTHTTSGNSMGVQWGAVGLADANFTGWQDNFVNYVKGDFKGLQWGFINYANYSNGLQLGFVNYAMRVKGLQIGLVNIIRQGGAFPVFPIVNWSF